MEATPQKDGFGTNNTRPFVWGRWCVGITQNYCILLRSRGQQSSPEQQSLYMGFALPSPLGNRLFIEISPSSGFFFFLLNDQSMYYTGGTPLAEYRQSIFGLIVREQKHKHNRAQSQNYFYPNSDHYPLFYCHPFKKTQRNLHIPTSVLLLRVCATAAGERGALRSGFHMNLCC